MSVILTYPVGLITFGAGSDFFSVGVRLQRWRRPYLGFVGRPGDGCRVIGLGFIHLAVGQIYGF